MTAEELPEWHCPLGQRYKAEERRHGDGRDAGCGVDFRFNGDQLADRVVFSVVRLGNRRDRPGIVTLWANKSNSGMFHQSSFHLGFELEGDCKIELQTLMNTLGLILHGGFWAQVTLRHVMSEGRAHAVLSSSSEAIKIPKSCMGRAFESFTTGGSHLIEADECLRAI